MQYGMGGQNLVQPGNHLCALGGIQYKVFGGRIHKGYLYNSIQEYLFQTPMVIGACPSF
jgi:hypothetical protein